MIRGGMTELADLVGSQWTPLLTNIPSNILEKKMYPRPICLALYVPSMAGFLAILIHRTRKRRKHKER